MYAFAGCRRTRGPRAGATESASARFDYGTPDGYRFFLDAGPLANVNAKYFDDSVPTWNDYMDHGTYDEYWQRAESAEAPRRHDAAVLIVAGWFDAEDFYGPFETYRAIEGNPATKNRIVVGPWLQGGWAGCPAMRWATSDSVQTGEYYRRRDRVPLLQLLPQRRGRGDNDRGHGV